MCELRLSPPHCICCPDRCRPAGTQIGGCQTHGQSPVGEHMYVHKHGTELTAHVGTHSNLRSRHGCTRPRVGEPVGKGHPTSPTSTCNHCPSLLDRGENLGTLEGWHLYTPVAPAPSRQLQLLHITCHGPCGHMSLHSWPGSLPSYRWVHQGPGGGKC